MPTKREPLPDEYLGMKTKKLFKEGLFFGEVVSVNPDKNDLSSFVYTVRYSDGDKEIIKLDALKKILTTFPKNKYKEYKQTHSKAQNKNIQVLANGNVKLKNHRNKTVSRVEAKNKTLSFWEEDVVAPRQVDEEIGGDENLLPANVYNFSKLFIPNSQMTTKMNELMFEISDDKDGKFKYNLPASFLDGVPTLEIKAEFKKLPKRTLIFSELEKGEYHTAGSNSDKHNASRLRTIMNNLPSFKQYKDRDNLEWIFEEHLTLFYELLEYHYKKQSSMATIRTYLNSIIRCFTIAFGKSYPLQQKYSLLNLTLKENLDAEESKNELNEVEQLRFLEWPLVIERRDELLKDFSSFENKLTQAAYDANQDLLTVALYTYIMPLRREIYTLEFTTNPNLLSGNHILMKDNGEWVLDLNEIKKKHDRIDIPIPSQLKKILKESYELYPRKYVFTHLNKYPDISKKATENSMAKRMSDIFEKYLVSVGASSLRSSWVSYRFNELSKLNGFPTLAEQENIARYMRTSVNQLFQAYAKIKQSVPIRAIDVMNLPPKPKGRVAMPAIMVTNLSKDGQIQQEAARRFTEEENKQIDEKLEKIKASAIKDQERLKQYYQKHKTAIKQRQAEYYKNSVDKTERNRKRILAKLKANLEVKKSTIEKYNIKESEYK
jgi:hypothetical protein